LGLGKNNIVTTTLLQEYFPSVGEFKKFSEEMLSSVEERYWV
jgi:hypothetical protein